MASLRRSGEKGSLSDRDISQAQFREQIGVVTDLLRQLTGDATVCSGGKQAAAPLTTPLVLYVDPLLGSDQYVTGFFNDYVCGGCDAEVFRSTVNRLSQQRLVCGYTPQRPFRTLNRAVLEAAMLLALPCFEPGTWQAERLQVLIQLAPGVHEVLNTPGNALSAAAPRPWLDGHQPSREELLWFNATGGGGLILPRGVRVQGAERDATVLRPLHVPGSVAEEDSEQRGAILAITGQSAISRLTFADQADYPVSHHLLDAVQIVRAADLQRFYDGVLQIAEHQGLQAALCRPMADELHFGPAATDTAGGAIDAASGWASLRDCRLQSAYGLGGVYADGRRMGGLQRLEVRQFQASSNQRDLEAWELVDPASGSAERVNAVRFASASAAALQSRQGFGHAAIRASHGAQLQVQGLEAEGFSCGVRAEAGAAVEVDGVLRYGVCGLQASGYREQAYLQDCGWHLAGVRAPEQLEEHNTTVRWLELGRLAQLEDTALDLQQPLEPGSAGPLLLEQQGYSLKAGSLVWIEAADGQRWSVPLAAEAWSADQPSRLGLDGALASGPDPVERPRELAKQLVGARVRLRRLVDQRRLEQRATALLLGHTQHGRLPEAGMVLQFDTQLPGAPLRPQPAQPLVVQTAFAPRWRGVGQLRTAAVVLAADKGPVAPLLALDDDQDRDPASLSCGWPLARGAAAPEGADGRAVASLLEAAGCCGSETTATLLEPKGWWQQEQLLESASGPVVLALHQGSRIAAQGLTLAAVGYGNRSKGELPQQIGLAAAVIKERQVQESIGGLVTMG